MKKLFKKVQKIFNKNSKTRRKIKTFQKKLQKQSKFFFEEFDKKNSLQNLEKTILKKKNQKFSKQHLKNLKKFSNEIKKK